MRELILIKISLHCVTLSQNVYMDFFLLSLESRAEILPRKIISVLIGKKMTISYQL
jgi:hypothetical protein